MAAIHLSDGQVLEGEVLLTPGINFSLGGIPEPGKSFAQVRTFNVDIVKEMNKISITGNVQREAIIAELDHLGYHQKENNGIFSKSNAFEYWYCYCCAGCDS